MRELLWEALEADLAVTFVLLPTGKVRLTVDARADSLFVFEADTVEEALEQALQGVAW